MSAREVLPRTVGDQCAYLSQIAGLYIGLSAQPGSKFSNALFSTNTYFRQPSCASGAATVQPGAGSPATLVLSLPVRLRIGAD